MKKCTDKTAEMLFWAMFYNGREDEVCQLYRDMKAFSEEDHGKDRGKAFMRPIYMYDGDDNDIEVFWMVFVQLFGEYGTSPRGGWFMPYMDNIKGAVEWLKTNIEATFQFEDKRW